jgi:phenol 2-monooxygenase (NADPH)
MSVVSIASEVRYVVVRPDIQVAHVLPLDAYAESDAFLRPIF